MKNILITSVGRRVQLTRAFVRALEKSQYRGKVITVDAGDYVPAAHFSHSHFKVPGFDSKEYVPKLLDICRKEQVGILIPLHEKEFPLLGQAREDFVSNGTLLMLSSDEVLTVCKDKYKTYLFFKTHGINTPHTFLPDMMGEVGDLIFPLFLKPRTGMGSANTYIVKDEKELDFFRKFVSDALIQEFVSGTEYTMDVLLVR
ncbi:MAG: ATP-grasp domain-containing protein [Carboxydocellales bacterium]